MLLLLQATQAADSVQVAADELMKEAIANADYSTIDRLRYSCRRTYIDCGPCFCRRTFPHLAAQQIHQASDG